MVLGERHAVDKHDDKRVGERGERRDHGEHDELVSCGLTHYDHRKFISANLIGTLIWGIGDDPERLFQRFARADDGTVHQGYGLGLALARDVVSRYHGWIDVESSSSQGTTMRITLPVA